MPSNRIHCSLATQLVMSSKEAKELTSQISLTSMLDIIVQSEAAIRSYSKQQSQLKISLKSACANCGNKLITVVSEHIKLHVLRLRQKGFIISALLSSMAMSANLFKICGNNKHGVNKVSGRPSESTYER